MTTQAQSFGSRLRSLRRERGWTQTELAERVGWTQGRISAYETGQRSMHLETAADLARVLDVSLDDMVGRDVA